MITTIDFKLRFRLDENTFLDFSYDKVGKDDDYDNALKIAELSTTTYSRIETKADGEVTEYELERDNAVNLLLSIKKFHLETVRSNYMKPKNAITINNRNRAIRKKIESRRKKKKLNKKFKK